MGHSAADEAQKLGRELGTLDRDERVLPNCSADLDYDAESLRASAMVSVAEFSLLSRRSSIGSSLRDVILCELKIGPAPRGAALIETLPGKHGRSRQADECGLC